MKNKIIICFGTRPEIIKLAPIISEIIKKRIKYEIVYSGQHFSKNMSDIFFKELGIKNIKYNLNEYKNSTQKKFYKNYKKKLLAIFKKETPKILIVQGDTNTCLMSALTAYEYNLGTSKKIKIAHVEAGLRSYDHSMPEEKNRIIVDYLSDILFPPTNIQKNILINEGVKKEIYTVGSTIADNLKKIKFKTIKKKYILLTIHRFENVNSKIKLNRIFEIVNSCIKKLNIIVIFPCHPNTKNKIKKYNIKLNKQIEILNPLSYKKFLYYIFNSFFILTDSGGIQEEACILKKHLITLRNNTERPETVRINSNFIAKFNKKKIDQRVNEILQNQIKWKRHPYGKNVSKKIVNFLIKNL